MKRSEFELIKKMQGRLKTGGDRVRIGIDDDAAVVKSPDHSLVGTVDLLVEGIHFELFLNRPRLLGRKALAVNVSDIAAMGGTPLYALVSLAIPSHLDDEFIIALYDGLQDSCERYDLEIVGGDTSRSPGPLFLDVTVWGEVEKPVKRTGARPGDLICVTGPLGDSAAGLQWLLHEKGSGREEKVLLAVEKGVEREDSPTYFVERHLDPWARVDAGKIAGKFATAMIDISDGLGSDLLHICQGSDVGAWVDQDKIPLSPCTRKMADYLQQDYFKWVLDGGEDYEMIMAVPKENIHQLKEEIDVHVIGEFKPKEFGRQVKVQGKNLPLLSGGWDHFRTL